MSDAIILFAGIVLLPLVVDVAHAMWRKRRRTRSARRERSAP